MKPIPSKEREGAGVLSSFVDPFINRASGGLFAATGCGTIPSRNPLGCTSRIKSSGCRGLIVGRVFSAGLITGETGEPTNGLSRTGIGLGAAMDPKRKKDGAMAVVCLSLLGCRCWPQAADVRHTEVKTTVISIFRIKIDRADMRYLLNGLSDSRVEKTDRKSRINTETTFLW